MTAATTTPESPEAREIIDRALKLSPAEQERVVLALLHNVSPPPISDADWEYWKAEIGRRVEAVRNGAVKPLTPEEVHANIRKALEESRKP